MVLRDQLRITRKVTLESAQKRQAEKVGEALGVV